MLLLLLCVWWEANDHWCLRCPALPLIYPPCPDWKTAPIWGITVLESSVSRHHGAQLRLSWKPSNHQSTIILRGLRRALNLSPIMPGNASHSDSYRSDRYCFPMSGNVFFCVQPRIFTSDQAARYFPYSPHLQTPRRFSSCLLLYFLFIFRIE